MPYTATIPNCAENTPPRRNIPTDASGEVSPELIKGRDGVFEVRLGDELIFSKRATGRFPSPGEVEDLLEGKLDA